MSEKTRLKGVAAGAGYFSVYQYEAWGRIPEVEIVAMYNRTESRGRERMAQFGIERYYGDVGEMLAAEKPDFIDIITPPATHYDICAAAAAAGVAIICQKPFGRDIEDARRIVELTEAAGVRLMIHENWRWQPWYREIKRIGDDGAIGDFTHAYFRMRTGDGWGEDAYLDRQPFFRDYPRLLVFETGVHFIDTFRFLLGDVAAVYARLRRLNPVIAGEDAGQIHFTFRSGATAIWDANRYNEPDAANPRYTFGELRIDATGGHLEMDASSEIRTKLLGQPSAVHDYERADVNFAGDCCYRLQRHFVDCFGSGEPFESNGRDYLKTLQVVEACYESAETGQAIKVEAER